MKHSYHDDELKKKMMVVIGKKAADWKEGYRSSLMKKNLLDLEEETRVKWWMFRKVRMVKEKVKG